MSIGRVYLRLLALTLSLCAVAHAETGGGHVSNESDGDSAAPGTTFDALPGVHRVGVASLPAPRLSAVGSGHYGYTEAQNDEDSGHHRFGASLAAGIAPWSFAAAALRLDFRHDVHEDDVEGSDSGSILDLTPIVRGGYEVSSGLHLGAEARARFSGAALSDGFPAPDFDLRALAAYLGVPSWTFALHAGYRLGLKGNVLEEAEALRPGDRVVLGISEFDALLIGLGATKKWKNTEFIAETTWDLLIGTDAPSAVESPFRISVGVRQALTKKLFLQGMLDVLPLSRAPSLSSSPLVPIEPRFTAQLGLAYHFDLGNTAKEAAPPQKEVKKAPPKVKPVPVVVAALPGSLKLTIVDEAGFPIGDAVVSLEMQQEGATAPLRLEVPLLRENIYVLDEVMPGSGQLYVEADLLQPQSQKLEVLEGDALELTMELAPESSLSSQLRGLVRSYSGKGLEATIEVLPGGHKTTCDANGEFALSLPPGKYEVIIKAEGFAEQRRRLSVVAKGVTVLNADLQSSSQ